MTKDYFTTEFSGLVDDILEELGESQDSHLIDILSWIRRTEEVVLHTIERQQTYPVPPVIVRNGSKKTDDHVQVYLEFAPEISPVTNVTLRRIVFHLWLAALTDFILQSGAISIDRKGFTAPASCYMERSLGGELYCVLDFLDTKSNTHEITKKVKPKNDRTGK